MAYNVFLATPKDLDPDEVTRFYTLTLDKFKKIPELETLEVNVVKAEDDYREHFSRCGGWDAWTRDVGQGVDYVYRTPRYNCIVCISQTVGKATADLVRHALEGNRMVVLIHPDGRFDRIWQVVEIDSNNYRSGWFLQI
jgi:hypothetical protein